MGDEQSKGIQKYKGENKRVDDKKKRASKGEILFKIGVGSLLIK